MFKITYIVSTLQRCGPIQQLLNLVKYLDRQRFLPQILTLSPEPHDSLSDEFTRLGVPVSSFRLGRFASFVQARRRLRDYISEHTPDIVHSCGLRADLFASCVDHRVHTVTTVRNHPFENYGYDFGWVGQRVMAPLHLRILRRIERVISVSRILSERLSREYELACDVILNGVDQESFFPVTTAQKRQIRSRLGFPLEYRLFAVTGYLSALKDPVCVAQGFLKAAVPNATMVFIGNGAMRDKIDLLSKSGKIVLTGRVTNVRPYLQGSDFLVSGSRTEGMPNAVLEAMACGLPCILSDIGAHKEIARYSPASTKLFRVSDSDSLAEKITEILAQDFPEMSSAAVQAVTRKFSAKTLSENYLQVYASLLGERQALPGAQRCSE